MRAHDWAEKLVRYIGARERSVFAWGRRAHDCCSFAAGGVLAISDIDLMIGIPEYASAEEADLVVGDKGLAGLMDERRPRRASIGLAQRGDVALVELTRHGEPYEALALIEGPCAVAPGLRRLERVPRGLIVAAWEV